jgi:hypothetical protein
VNIAGYPSIQEAIDDAYARGDGIVLIPSGEFTAKQIVLRQGISLVGMGMNPPPHGRGTILKQAASENADFLVNDTNLQGKDH